MSSENGDDAWRTFRALVESADRKFARVRDAEAYGRVREFQKVFKAYMRVWKYQQENRARLVAAGLSRSEIGEIASRIGQLYFGHYLRTSQSRFLAESCVFYEAILNRSYFDASHLSVRFKELRFYARFLLVAFLLCRPDLIAMLMERFRAVVEESRAIFRETDFKEWGQVIEEAVRFTRADTARSLRYFPSASGGESRSEPYLARFHAKKVLKFQDALLCGFHRKEVKFAEITLDAFRMMQCLEWEPAFIDHAAKKKMKKKPPENGVAHSGPSGLIDITVADPTLAPNPRKAVLYRPTVTHLISVMATICEELPPDCVILVYLSASGKPHIVPEGPGGVGSQKPPRNKTFALHDLNNALPEPEGDSPNGLYDSYLWFGPRGRSGSNNLYPGDLVPFTRRPLFLIIDSDTSHAFKVLHGIERGEPAALLLSPLKPTLKKPCDADQNGSQFTFFLTSPLAAFCQLVGLSSSDTEEDVYNDAEEILATAFSEWEVILCTSKVLDVVWGQVLGDPFLRRLILRFILCRAILFLFCPPEESKQCLPTCLPPLPNSVSPDCEAVKSAVLRLAEHFRVSDCFHSDRSW